MNKFYEILIKHKIIYSKEVFNSNIVFKVKNQFNFFVIINLES